MVFILKCTTYIRPYKWINISVHLIGYGAKKNELNSVFIIRFLDDYATRKYKNLLDPTKNDMC